MKNMQKENKNTNKLKNIFKNGVFDLERNRQKTRRKRTDQVKQGENQIFYQPNFSYKILPLFSHIGANRGQ